MITAYPESFPEVPQGYRTCSRCREEQHVLAFRPLGQSTEKRRRQCNRCHAAYERERRQRKQKRRLDKLAMKIKSEPSHARVAAAVAEEAFHHFGGVKGLARDWVAHIKEQVKLRPAARAAGAGFLAMGRLLEFTDRHNAEQSKRRMATMSDDELADEVTRDAFMLLIAQPGLLEAACDALGYTLIRPAGREVS